MSEATLLFCQCTHARVMSEEVNRAVEDRLLQGGLSMEIVTDLCGLAARKDPWLKGLAEQDDLTIVACFPRAVQWLFHAAGADLKDSAEIFNMREMESHEIIATLLSRRTGKSETAGAVRRGVDGWVPWFPVIDYDRCTSCFQCKKFCLFGVFAESEASENVVRNPANCKINCPACARICPETAIIFPKYAAAPINGSDEMVPEAGEQSQVDLKSLLKGDLYETLRNRGGDKSDLLEAAKKLAEAERLQCAGAGEASPEGAELMKSLCGCACNSSGKDETEPATECCEPNDPCCDPATGCCEPDDPCCDPTTGCCEPDDPCCDPTTGCCDEVKPKSEPDCGCKPASGASPDDKKDKPCCG